MVFGIFLFCLDLELFAKIENDLVSKHLQKPVFLITQDLNKFKKIPNTRLQTLVRRKCVPKFLQKILNPTVVGAHQSFQFFRKTT